MLPISSFSNSNPVRRARAAVLPWALAAALCALTAPPALAEKSDRNQPMNIEADQLKHDELQQTSVFTGRVVVTKGSIVLRGARLEVRQDADGYQSVVVTGGGGKRAFFRQKRDTAAGAPEEFIEGEGETIEYSGKADTVRFITRAELRRFRAGDLSDEITGDVIVYNNLTDVFTVDGRNTGKSPGDAGGSGGRVRAILAPRDATPATPAVPAPGPTPELKPSDRLEGARR
ncbi:lipopolysaccharide transport periplasmic protein LptA [Simplicispira suum]|uniref:Lipopolysaccharide export system protein LptA n=1 Tax=Simplicispira suum TaxID=2109915 RepID=A0A2S0MYI0_9BURK|nr:lipopolysaccharide transport periplasmic protein LptA [Simplicispira suum]AVO40857.1 lipopolysaccharide transport periplasmic protein LptA [Simplicispira suum]